MEKTYMNDFDEKKMFEEILFKYFDIMEKNFDSESYKHMVSKVCEYNAAKILNGKVTNGTGSDITIEKNTHIILSEHELFLQTNELCEIKAVYKHFKKYCRAQNVIKKQGRCDYMFFEDFISKRKFLIPCSEFYNNSKFSDIKHTQSFMWNYDYIPSGEYAENTKLLLQYEIID